MNKKIKPVLRVYWRGMLGTVLASGAREYFVAFDEYCQYIPKWQCALVYGRTA